MVAAAIGDARICTVNLPEVISHFTHLGMPAEAALARTAGQLRGPIASASLSLGDRFCLALASHEGRPAWTADRAWLDVAETVGVEVVLIR